MNTEEFIAALRSRIEQGRIDHPCKPLCVITASDAAEVVMLIERGERLIKPLARELGLASSSLHRFRRGTTTTAAHKAVHAVIERFDIHGLMAVAAAGEGAFSANWKRCCGPTSAACP